MLSLDGSTLEVADTAPNVKAFGRPGASRGTTASPQLRFVSLVEHGTQVLVGSQLGRYRDGETTLARNVVPALGRGMLCLADRQFFGWPLWQQAAHTGADLLWRVKKNARLPCLTRWPDGSYRSVIYPSERDRRHGTHGLAVRVIEYTVAGVAEAEDRYRLVTTDLANQVVVFDNEDVTKVGGERLTFGFANGGDRHINVLLRMMNSHRRGQQ